MFCDVLGARNIVCCCCERVTIVLFNLRTFAAVPLARAGLLAAAPAAGRGQGLAAVLAGLAPLLLGGGRRQRARVLERGRRPAQVSIADC